MTTSYEILTGRTKEHLVLHPSSNRLMHKEVLKPFTELYEAGKKQGFEIWLTSAFRDYDLQLSIWNAKARGEKTLFDSEGIPVDYDKLSEKEIVTSILRWNAIPGTSRHHWGTDIDIYDKNQVPEGYKVQLIPQENTPDGMFGKLHLWLDHLMAKKNCFGFYRPYESDRGGVAPEKWHISYSPISLQFGRDYTLETFERNIEESDLLLKHILLEDLDFYFKRYVANVSHP